MVKTKSHDISRKIVIFDFDGTIADSIGVFEETTRELSGGNINIEAGEVRSLRSLVQLAERVKTPFWRFGGTFSKIRAMVDKNIDRIEVFDGLTEAIEELYKSNYALFIVSTNSRSTIEKFLKINHLSQYFSGIFGSDRIIKSKYHSLRLLLGREKLHASQCVVVGDEPRDVEVSRAVGANCIAVTWGFTNSDTLSKLGPTKLVEHPSELVRAVELLQLEP